METVDWECVLKDSATTGKGGNDGVKKSEDDAAVDLERIKKKLGLHQLFQDVGKEFDVPPAIVAAIASRESNMGAMLKDGWGDHGNGFGIMQVDKRSHNPLGTPDPFSEEHIRQATCIYVQLRSNVHKKHPTWDCASILKGGCVAYNAGLKNVQTLENMDKGTTGDNYGSDVLARAKWFQKKWILEGQG